jgi:hypothetical protein
LVYTKWGFYYIPNEVILAQTRVNLAQTEGVLTQTGAILAQTEGVLV